MKRNIKDIIGGKFINNNQIRKLYYFYISYKELSFFTLIALVISILYFPVNDRLDYGFFKNALTWLNGIALAIIANCLFSYFQLFLPNYKNANIFISNIESDIKGVLYNMTERLNMVYRGTMNCRMDFGKMKKEDFYSFFSKLDLNQHQTGHNIIYSPATYLDELNFGISYTDEIIERMLNNYREYMDNKLVDILIKIKNDNYIKIIQCLKTSSTSLGKFSDDTCKTLADKLYEYQLSYITLKSI